MKTPKDLLYRLFRQRHMQRWKQFLEIASLERLRITLFIINHGNRVHTRDVVAGLLESGDSRSSETLKRLLRYMKSDGFLTEDSEGFLSVRKLKGASYVIKQRRSSLVDYWFLGALAVSISALIINLFESNFKFGTISILLLAIIIFIVLRILDDWLHETAW